MLQILAEGQCTPQLSVKIPLHTEGRASGSSQGLASRFVICYIYCFPVLSSFGGSEEIPKNGSVALFRPLN